jgi:hypothetical protein
MSEAPERIWADGNAEWDSGSWGLDKEFDNDVEYVRADRIEELEAKLAKAVEALDRIQDGSYGKLAAKARTILAELKGEDRG